MIKPRIKITWTPGLVGLHHRLTIDTQQYYRITGLSINTDYVYLGICNYFNGKFQLTGAGIVLSDYL